jgi:hypothetical protein
MFTPCLSVGRPSSAATGGEQGGKLSLQPAHAEAETGQLLEHDAPEALIVLIADVVIIAEQHDLLARFI